MSEDVCVSLLVSGQPQAFSDLFILTHQSSESSQTLDGTGTAIPEPSSLSQESVALLSQQLVSAHTAYRAGQCEASYDSYQQLAEHFTSLAQLPNANFFYLRCLQVADEHKWTEGQAAAHTNLGMLAQQLGDLETAERHFEQQLSLMGSGVPDNNDGSDHAAAYADVMKVHENRAQQFADAGNREAQLASLKKWIRAAELSGDPPSLAQAHMQCGLAHQQQGDHAKAVHCLEQHIQLCAHLDHVQPDAKAFCALAECQQILGNMHAAVETLQSYLLKSRHQDARGEACACCNLGVLHYWQQQYEDALTHFERFFEAARLLKDQKVLDVARVNLGAARAALNFKDYVQVADVDLQTLLLWKNTRMPLKEQNLAVSLA